MTTKIFYLIFAFWGVYSSYLIIRKNKNQKVWQYLYDSIPSLFTTLGILGTFVGIFIGLQDFDVHNINESIPILLEGMKTAFSTSILGILLSVVFGKISGIVKEKSELEYNIGEVEDELSALKAILQEIQMLSIQNNELSELNKKQVVFVEKIHSSIEKNNSDLVTMIKQTHLEQEEVLREKLRVLTEVKQIIINNSTIIEEKFDNFSEMLSKNNTEALVEVMKNVTEEFNKQMSSLINRLVQENFEELNNSVNRLNSWQQENKEMIVSLTNQFTKVSEDFVISASSIKEITLQTQLLTDRNSYLSKMIQELQKVMLEETNFQKLAANLSDTAELLHNNTKTFDETTNKLNNWIRNQMNFTDSVAVLLTKLEEVKNIKDINEVFWKNFENQLNTSMKKIEKASEKLNEDLDTINDEFYNQLNDVLSNFDNALQRIMKSKGI